MLFKQRVRAYTGAYRKCDIYSQQVHGCPNYPPKPDYNTGHATTTCTYVIMCKLKVDKCEDQSSVFMPVMYTQKRKKTQVCYLFLVKTADSLHV